MTFSARGSSQTSQVLFTTTNCDLQYHPVLNHIASGDWWNGHTTLIVANPTADTISVYVRFSTGETPQFAINGLIEPSVNVYIPKS